jgi:hypothetical protein
MKIMLLVSVLFLAQCSAQPTPEEKTGTIHSESSEEVYRVIDDEAGVVCWVFDGSSGGISCLPLDQVRDGLAK